MWRLWTGSSSRRLRPGRGRARACWWRAGHSYCSLTLPRVTSALEAAKHFDYLLRLPIGIERTVNAAKRA